MPMNTLSSADIIVARTRCLLSLFDPAPASEIRPPKLPTFYAIPTGKEKLPKNGLTRTLPATKAQKKPPRTPITIAIR